VRFAINLCKAKTILTSFIKRDDLRDPGCQLACNKVRVTLFSTGTTSWYQRFMQGIKLLRVGFTNKGRYPYQAVPQTYSHK